MCNGRGFDRRHSTDLKRDLSYPLRTHYRKNYGPTGMTEDIVITTAKFPHHQHLEYFPGSRYNAQITTLNESDDGEIL